MQESNKIVSEINELIKEARDLRKSYEYIWLENIAFYLGKHYAKIDEGELILNMTKSPSWRVRAVFNKIQTFALSVLARMIKVPIRFGVKCGKDLTDIYAARATKKLLQYIVENDNIGADNKFKEFALNGIIYGKSYIKVFWDIDLGPYVSKEDNIKAGDVNFEVLSPFSVIVDPSAQCLDKANWVCIVKHGSRKALEEQYEMEIKPVNIKDKVIRNFENILGLSSKVPKDFAVIYEYFERRSSKYPDGRHIVIANDTIIFERELPFKSFEYPLVEFDFIKTPGSYYGETILTQLVPIQKYYNKARSQIIEHANLMAKGKWLIPITAQVSDNSITDEPGEKIKYNPAGGPITQVPMAPLPNYVIENIAMIQKDMNEAAGLFSFGAKLPPGIRSGIAIAYLQEMDDTIIGVATSNFYNAVVKVARYLLSIIKEKYIEQRTLKILGKGAFYETFTFKGTDITSPENVVIEPTPNLPVSKTARQQFILQLAQMGLFPDPKYVLKVLELTPDWTLEVEGADEDRALEENYKLMRGEIVKAEDYDNHEIHISIHTLAQKSKEYEELPEVIKQNFEAHKEEHKKFIQLTQMQLLTNLMMAKQKEKGTKEKTE